MYEALAQFLVELPAGEQKVWLTLCEIERLVGVPLPATAHQASYWSGSRGGVRPDWLRHGFVARLDRRAAAVCFTRQHNSAAADGIEERGSRPAAASGSEAPQMGSPHGGKYAPLIRLLEHTPPDQGLVQLTTAEIEAILGEPLPASALRPGYWSSPGLNASRAWKRLGFVVRLDRDLRRVLFIRKAA